MCAWPGSVFKGNYTGQGEASSCLCHSYCQTASKFCKATFSRQLPSVYSNLSPGGKAEVVFVRRLIGQMPR